jgi:hypothetical protein
MDKGRGQGAIRLSCSSRARLGAPGRRRRSRRSFAASSRSALGRATGGPRRRAPLLSTPPSEQGHHVDDLSTRGRHVGVALPDDPGSPGRRAPVRIDRHHDVIPPPSTVRQRPLMGCRRAPRRTWDAGTRPPGGICQSIVGYRPAGQTSRPSRRGHHVDVAASLPVAPTTGADESIPPSSTTRRWFGRRRTSAGAVLPRSTRSTNRAAARD